MIIYSVVAREKDAVVLVECSQHGLGGNASQASLALLEYLRDHPEKILDGDRMSFVQRNDEVRDWFSDIINTCTGGTEGQQGNNEHYFHVLRKAGVYYCCLSDDAQRGEQKVSFALLDHIQVEFTKRFSERRINKANAYAMEKTFSPDMRSAMHHYNVNHNTLSQEEKVMGLSAEIQDLKDVMGRNINLLLRRGENVEKLLEKSETLRRDSVVFRKRSDQLKRNMGRRSWCLTLMFVWAGVTVVYMIAAAVCGLSFSRCSFKESSSNSNE